MDGDNSVRSGGVRFSRHGALVLTVESLKWIHFGFFGESVMTVDFPVLSLMEEAQYPDFDELEISRLLDRNNAISDAFKALGFGEVPSF